MDIIWGLIVVGLIFSPYILSILAIVRSNAARREIEALRRQLEHFSRPKAPEVTAPVDIKPTGVVSPQPRPTTLTHIAPPPVRISEPTPVATPQSTEVTFGGKIASFAGIGLLLIGVAFLMGYAIKHAWLGPKARIFLGYILGTVLVVLGHVAETRGKDRLALLARSLTGGGTAIFYFCVFAAYGIYHFISAPMAGVGLVLCAAVALGLAVAYRSQAVAIVGVLGAFLMPPLIGDNTSNTLFLLIYIATINVPVIALGFYRKWQTLYNAAFGFTALYMLGLLLRFDQREGLMLLLFSLIYFLQFAGLGLLKLRSERAVAGRTADVVRLLLNSLLLMVTLYSILERMDWDTWTGAAFIAAALVHLGIVKIGWKWRPGFEHDMLALLAGALMLTSLALPVQLDGAWVSVGWSIEGAILCWFALRTRIPMLQLAAFLLGGIGIMKTLVFDVYFYNASPSLFLNARFISGLLASALLGFQGWLHARQPAQPSNSMPDISAVIPALSVLALLMVCAVDIFWTLGEHRTWAWLLSSLVLVLIATTSALTLNRLPFMVGLSRGLLLLVPLKLLFDLSAIHHIHRGVTYSLFMNMPFVVLAAIAIFMAMLLPKLLQRSAPVMLSGAANYSLGLIMSSLLSGILIVTAEIYRMASGWDQTVVTIWWATCAIALVFVGMIRRSQPHRYAGLWLFGATTLKVLIIDLDELGGLPRIAACMVVGVLLLLLSFVYQRAAARLSGENTAQQDETL